MFTAKEAQAKARTPWSKDEELATLLKTIESSIQHAAGAGKFELTEFLSNSQAELKDRLKVKLDEVGYDVRLISYPDWHQVVIRWGNP